MPSTKKSKKRSTAKSAKKVRQHAAKPRSSKSRTKEKAAQKRAVSRPKARTRRRAPSVSAETELKREFRTRNLTASGIVSARQTADFEGLPRAEQANSESVHELVEEGNLFEAGAVAGVEEADNADEREVHTHELPEDDIPEEYSDKD